jgi:hypothetical protein
MNTQIIAILGVLAMLSTTLHLHQDLAYAQTTIASASVSIVPGSSSPSISKPYDPSPLTVTALYFTSIHAWTNHCKINSSAKLN